MRNGGSKTKDQRQQGAGGSRHESFDLFTPEQLETEAEPGKKRAGDGAEQRNKTETGQKREKKG